MKEENPNGEPEARPKKKTRREAAVPDSTPDEIRRNIIPLSRGLGVASPAAAGTKPALDIEWPLQQLGRELGLLASSCELFRQGDAFVTVDARNGELRLMEPARFCSWVESVAWTFKTRQTGAAFARMGKEIANLLLATDEFRDQVRELRGVHVVRLPVWRGKGPERTIDLLPEGFDRETGIYTVDSVPFDSARALPEAGGWIAELLEHYPWGELPEDLAAGCARNMAAHVAAMLSPFVRLLLPADAHRPIIVYNGNQPGTGKSTLARMALFPVYGDAPARSVDRNPEELRKVLESTVIERTPFLFLDDMGDLRSRELNAFVTTGQMSVRPLGQSRSITARVEAQVFLTGNQLDIGRELERRALVIDLFLSCDAASRTFEQEITDEWLLLPETRAAFLSFLWACVRHWRDTGMTIDPAAKRPSFKAYAELVGSITASCKFGAPFAERENVMGGDEEGNNIRELLAAVAARVEDGKTEEFSTSDLLQIAEETGLLDGITLAKDQRKSLGQKIKAWRGRQLRDSKGRMFEFGRRGGSRGAIYPVTILPA